MSASRLNSSPSDSTDLALEDALKTRSTAQRRFTPVGLVKTRASADLRSFDLALSRSLPLALIAARTKPYAPTTPINGAPLTFIERIAEQTWSTVRIRTYTSLPGNLVVSIASNTPFFHLTDSRESSFFPGISQNSAVALQLFACLYRRLPGLGLFQIITGCVA